MGSEMELPSAVCINEGRGEYAILRIRQGQWRKEQLSKAMPSTEEAWQDAYSSKEAENAELKKRFERLAHAKSSLVDYSNPDLCAHCGGIIRKGHTEWFHFDGYVRESRYCEHGGGKKASPETVELKKRVGELEEDLLGTRSRLSMQRSRTETAEARVAELEGQLREMQWVSVGKKEEQG